MRCRHAFVLLEAIVAMTIVGLVSVSVLAMLGTQLRAAGRTRSLLEARALADDRMATLRMLPRNELIDLDDSLRSGRFPVPFERFEWQMESKTIRGENNLFALSVRVRWTDGTYSLDGRVFRPSPRTTPGQ